MVKIFIGFELPEKKHRLFLNNKEKGEKQPMLSMILKMSAVTGFHVLLTVILWIRVKDKPMTTAIKIGVGFIYGLCSIASTHFAIDYGNMLLNVRDIGPLAAGLFFDPVSGIIAGLMGGIERYIVGTYFGIGSYTRIACSVSTCLAGFVSVFMSVNIFNRKKPSPIYAFFMGAVMEVFHMYVVLLTHRNDMKMAYQVVRVCSYPMIFFTGLGLALSSIALQVAAGEWRNPFKKRSEDQEMISERFERWLFMGISLVFLFNFCFSLMIQYQNEKQKAAGTLTETAANIIKTYDKIQKNNGGMESLYYFTSGHPYTFDIIKTNGTIVEGNHKLFSLRNEQIENLLSKDDDSIFEEVFFNKDSLCRLDILDNGMLLLTLMPKEDVFEDLELHVIETTYADVLLISVVYVLISFLVQQLVVNNLNLVNASLSKITHGDLNEVVSVRNTSEFASLSDDINKTVDVLKGYIDAAEKRIEEELQFAYTIQDSSLPKNFKFPRDDFEIFASMDPAKEVGGDFYDFFFTDTNKLVLVIADVSGKGIPAALFMMRSKTAIRGQAEEGKSPSEIMSRTNEILCEGNDAEMFVTVWLGIVDLETGKVQCANAGHEYPVIKHPEGEFELLKDKHSLPLAAMPMLRAREYEIQLEPGDRLFVYTDGVPEAINDQTQEYGTERMLDILNKEKDRPMEELLPAVREDISDFVGKADQFDDITMLGFTWLKKAGS